MNILSYRRYYFIASLLCVLLALFSIVRFGLSPSIEFTGGSLMRVSFTGERPAPEIITETVKTVIEQGVSVQTSGESGFVIKTRDLTEEERLAITNALRKTGNGTLKEDGFTSIGPSIGQELRDKALWAMALVVLFIILFIAFSFRHVSKPVSSWRYGVIAIVALAHDVIIPTGFFAYLTVASGAEADALFVTALLAILGLSVSDTIVVFDRIREKLKNTATREPFTGVVEESLKETISRSINTSVTILLAVLALYLFGPESTQFFALVLGVGLLFGTYSSIFIASPLLVSWESWRAKNRKPGN
jgi:preprotein translocase subunit SecF